MLGFYRRIRRKRNHRRLLASAFLVVAVVEIGSHAYMDSSGPWNLMGLPICSLSQNHPVTANCPDRQRHRGRDSNLMDEMSIHAMILNNMDVAASGISYRANSNFELRTRTLSGILTPPFHPPKQA